MERTKVCAGCGLDLPLVDFYLQRGGKLGRSAKCRPCQKAWWLAMPARKAMRDAAEKKYRSKPEVRARLARAARLRRQDPEILARINAKRRAPEQREKVRAWRRKYYFERQRNNRAFMFCQRAATNIRDAMKGRPGLSKRPLWWQAPLGYTVADLRQHLESLFTDGLTWENHGVVWELDHIKPLASFDIPNAACTAFKEAWALSNLRPLLKHLNRAKGAKLPD